MAQKQPTKRQRDVMRMYRASPLATSQVEVMKRLGLKDRNEFYRLYTRCDVTDRLIDLAEGE